MTKTLHLSRLAAAVLVPSSIAWIVMILQHSPWFTVLPLPLQVSHADPWLSAGWLLSWLIMIVAMMLPPALPFFRAVGRLVRGRSGELWLAALAALLFVSAWMVAGLLLSLLSLLISQGLALNPWLHARQPLLAGLAVLAAGLYQLSPLKQSCLTACRSPTGLMLVHWRPDQPVSSLASVALRYSLVCIGCCWPLMAVTLLVGSLLLPVMVIVSLLMLCERLLPSVRKLIPIQAGFAFALAVLLFADSGVNSGRNSGDATSPLAPDPVTPHQTHDHLHLHHHHQHGQAR